MNGLHSIAGSVVASGTIYGWRIDAMLMSGALWILIAAAQQVRGSMSRPLATTMGRG